MSDDRMDRSVRHFCTFMMDFENGDIDEQQTIDFFQELIDTGTVWHLQGDYGRMASNSIRNKREFVCPWCMLLGACLAGAFPPTMDKDGLPFVPVNFEAQAFVAEIVSVPAGTWTNGNPPTLKINVIDALGSQVPLGPYPLMAFL